MVSILVLRYGTNLKLKSDRMLESQQSVDCYSGYGHWLQQTVLGPIIWAVDECSRPDVECGDWRLRPCWERGRAQPGNCGDRWPGDWWRWVMLSQIRTSRLSGWAGFRVIAPHTHLCPRSPSTTMSTDNRDTVSAVVGGGNNTKRWFTLTTPCEEVIHRERLMVISSVPSEGFPMNT